MTVEQEQISRKIRNEFKRNILMQVLSEKTTSSKTRRELVFSARNSVSSHVSKKLLLEEHKLDVRLEQIEKERRQFLNNNNNEKYMLRLSLGVQSAREWRKKQRNKAIQRRHSEGNQISQKETSHSKSISVLTGQKCIKKRELTKTRVKQLERMKDWERDYVTPQAPPPSRMSSRAPSTVNIFLHNTTTHTEIMKPVAVATLLAWSTTKPVATVEQKTENGELLICTNNFDEGGCGDSCSRNSQKLLSSEENQDSHSEENHQERFSNLLSTLKTNRAIKLLPSVTKLNISKNSYQYPAQRVANIRNCKDEEVERRTSACDEIESSHKSSLSSVVIRDEVGDSRSNTMNAWRDGFVEQPATCTTIVSRVEIGSNRQQRLRTGKSNSGRVSSSKRNPRTNVEARHINLQLSGQEVNTDYRERNSMNFKTKKPNSSKHCNNKTQFTRKRENGKNHEGNAANDVSRKQSKKFLRKLTYDDTGPVAKHAVAKDGVYTLHGGLCNHTPSEEKHCVVQEEISSQNSYPNHISPLCLPSPNQMKKFTQNARKTRKEKAFLKMRRYKDPYRQALQLQLNG